MKSKTFCLAPWTHGLVHSDMTLRPCCVTSAKSTITFNHHKEWWNNPDMQKLRSDLYNGVQNANCESCWKNESLGKESLRLSYNNIFKKYADFDEIIRSAANDFVVNTSPITWDLRLGNFCNLKCVMCRPEYSDKIEKELQENSKVVAEIFPNQIKIDTPITNWTTLPQAEEFFNYLRGTVRWLKLQGGEPLAVKSVRELIQSLDKNQTTLAVTTNGTVLDPVLHEALAKMDRVEFTVSLEAIGPANDIIRYGSDWETIKDHILTLKQLPNVDIQINHVLQITSVFYLKDVLQFSEEQGFHLSLQNLCHADYLSLSACPTKYLQKMIEDIDKIEIKHVKNQYIKTFLHNILDNVVFDGNQWNNFKNYINLLDQLRPNRYSSVLKFEEDIL